jgi:hypothetical protein
VRVEQQRARGAGHPQLAVDERVAAGLEQFCGKPAALQHAAQVFRIPADVRTVRGDIRDRQQPDELRYDLCLM